jgi:hypothetical protein
MMRERKEREDKEREDALRAMGINRDEEDDDSAFDWMDEQDIDEYANND